MTPTQAQIEAAIVAFCKSAGYRIEPRITERSQLRRDLTVALTAAAEVAGDKHLQMYNEAMIRAVIADTIERCAQLADRYVDESFIAGSIAAEIRAMKDQP